MKHSDLYTRVKAQHKNKQDENRLSTYVLVHAQIHTQ